MPRRPSPAPAPASRTTSCPCGLPAPYASCCGPLHTGAAAPDPERLMRSRYTAFARRDPAYLLHTWHSTTRPATLDLDPAIRWTGLDVLGTTGGSAFHTEGTVEFRAHYALRGEAVSQHENSRFVREDGRWVYVGAVG